MEQQQQHAPSGHYSGANPVPTVKKFIENLDKDKRERDRKLDEEATAQRQTAQQTGGDAVPHKPTKGGVKGTQKKVTDPTTGREVVIEDVNEDMIKEVQDPHVRFHDQNVQKQITDLNSFLCPMRTYKKTP